MWAAHNRTDILHFELFKVANLDETCNTRLESVRNVSAVFVLVGVVLLVAYGVNIKDKCATYIEG